jgi:hypothetical protein
MSALKPAALAGALALALSLAPSAAAGTPDPPDERPDPPAPVRLRVAATGDLLIHSPNIARALRLGGGSRYVFSPMFARVAPHLRAADLALCHVETPIGAGTPSGYPRFSAPASLAAAIAHVGFDACSTASNHTLDRGQAGINSTLQALDRHGIHHAGSARTRAESRRLTLFTVKGVRVALLSATDVDNGLPQAHPWSVNRLSVPRLVADAQRARRAGARLVIVNLHWGVEYRHQPSPRQRSVALRLTRAPAIDAVVGQHAHVVQPIERVNGKPVVFGTGNLISNQTSACCPAATQNGIVALLDFTVGPRGARVTRMGYLPTRVRHPDFTVLVTGRARTVG